MPTTTFYFDIGSPYAYLAAERLERVLAGPINWQPVLLGGLASAPANLDLRRWEGRAGQRRKERLAVFLKRCVCTGDITLAQAQSAIAGDWENRFPNLSSLTCTGS